MKRGTTLFLKITVILIGTVALALCLFGLPWLVDNPVSPDYAPMLYPIITGMYVTVIPFFVALYQAFKLLRYIDKKQAFSESSVKALKNIKFCATIISGVYMVVLPFVFLVADQDDAPGLIFVGMIPVFTSIVIATFAAVLQMLLKDAIDMKNDNDLTI